MRELRPCGTTAAYRRHQRHGEKPCRACKNAFNVAQVTYPSRTPEARWRRGELLWRPGARLR